MGVGCGICIRDYSNRSAHSHRMGMSEANYAGLPNNCGGYTGWWWGASETDIATVVRP